MHDACCTTPVARRPLHDARVDSASRDGVSSLVVETVFNPRDNGACPLCTKRDDCRLRAAIREALRKAETAAEGEIEIVIYTCPRFEEKP